jgi:hypothetical protein
MFSHIHPIRHNAASASTEETRPKVGIPPQRRASSCQPIIGNVSAKHGINRVKWQVQAWLEEKQSKECGHDRYNYTYN